MVADLFTSSWTGREIAQQPDVWRATAAIVTRERSRIDQLLSVALADPGTRILLTGAGTSAYVGEVVAPALAAQLGRSIEAVASTDIVAAPRSVILDDRPVLLVSFARSGNSPESVAAAELIDQLASAVWHLVITANVEGELATRMVDSDRSVVLTLPPEANDRGFAMTSSFTAMALAALLSFGVTIDVDRLATVGEGVLAVAEQLAGSVAETQPKRLVYLGSGALTGLARESALKCLELTRGGLLALAESSLGFRHGPKSILDADTYVVVYLSGDPYTRAYDLDIVAELLADLGPERVIVVDPDLTAEARHWAVPRSTGWSDAVWALVAVIPAQAAALACSVAAGLTPDNPFPGGEVNRVVQGVSIHPLPGGR